MATDANNTPVNTPEQPSNNPDQTPKVTFTPEQQDHLNVVIQERLKRASEKSQKELEAIKAEKAALEAKLADASRANTPATPSDPQTPTAEQIAEFKRVSEQSKLEVEAARKAAEAKANEAKVAQDRLVKYQKETAINAEANKQNFIDPNIVVQLVEHNVHIGEDGKLTILGDNGEQRYNSSYQPMSLGEFIAEFATQRSYLVRGDTKTGAG